MSRNTTLLKETVTTLEPELDDPEYALELLESHFHDALLVNVGNVAEVGTYAEQLRLQITAQERATVFDHLAKRNAVTITVDHVETAINELFRDRFIEP